MAAIEARFRSKFRRKKSIEILKKKTNDPPATTKEEPTRELFFLNEFQQKVPASLHTSKRPQNWRRRKRKQKNSAKIQSKNRINNKGQHLPKKKTRTPQLGTNSVMKFKDSRQQKPKKKKKTRRPTVKKNKIEMAIKTITSVAHYQRVMWGRQRR